MWLFIGLGNPGAEYARTRHNIGFMSVDAMAERWGISFDRKGGKALIAEGTVYNERIVCAKPQTYMNLSGEAVINLTQWYKTSFDHVLILYDDFDLPFGRLRVRLKGGPGSHNGMKSIIGAVGHENVPRLRIGIGKPPPAWDVTKYVLGRFLPEEQDHLPPLLNRITDHMEEILRSGLVMAMNQINISP